MVKVECSTTIKRSVEDVFAVLSNPANDVKWSSAALEAELTSPGPVGVGTTSRSVSKILGRRIESKWEVTEFEPNRRLAAQSHSGPFPVQASITAEPDRGRHTGHRDLPGGAGRFFQARRAAHAEDGEAAIAERSRQPEGPDGSQRVVGHHSPGDIDSFSELTAVRAPFLS
jgi:uncharacterized protein YndB with AHSA1/START domain